MNETDNQKTEEFRIENVEQIKELWSKTYNTEGKPDWSHILPYYADDIYFRDSIQGIHGIEEFSAMTKRLSDRSRDLKMRVVRAMKEDQTIFVEWEMTISFKTRPSSVLYGASRLSLNDEGKIAEQRDATGNYRIEWTWHFEVIGTSDSLQLEGQATNTRHGMDFYDFWHLVFPFKTYI